LLADLNAEVGTEDIFTPTTKNESLQETCNEKQIKVVKVT
jgi:hypothetical protein